MNRINRNQFGRLNESIRNLFGGNNERCLPCEAKARELAEAEGMAYLAPPTNPGDLELERGGGLEVTRLCDLLQEWCDEYNENVKKHGFGCGGGPVVMASFDNFLGAQLNEDLMPCRALFERLWFFRCQLCEIHGIGCCDGCGTALHPNCPLIGMGGGGGMGNWCDVCANHVTKNKSTADQKQGKMPHVDGPMVGKGNIKYTK